MDREEQFIPFIHNYCDRWCERCEFTSRCSVFAAEQELTDEEKDITSDAFYRNIRNIFADAKALLIEKAEEFGIDIEPISDEEFAEIQARQDASIHGEEITKLAEKYAWDTRPILEAKDEWLDESGPNDLQTEVLEVLYWYQFFISAKIQRGLHGILDVDGYEETDEIRDSQSDANGSIKLALIAIERSILAWTYLLSPQNADTIRPLIALLEKISRMAEQKFPNARDFVRPGFDEIEMVM